MALSFRRNGDGSFSVTIPQAEREHVGMLIEDMRELIAEHDQLTWRLFPNPYPDHDKAADEYAEMIGDELREKHLASLDMVRDTLDAKRLEADQLSAWMHAVNHLRLVIGTRLDVTEESDLDNFTDPTDQALFLTYIYLGYMLEQIVQAIAGE